MRISLPTLLQRYGTGHIAVAIRDLFCVGLIFSISISLFFALPVTNLSTILAQESGLGPGETLTTNPKERQVDVSATVADNTPPTTPILISPTNNSYVTDSTPTFKWEASSDANGIGHYEFSLDGSVLFSSLPTTSTETSEYILVYDSVNDDYLLTVKNSLSEGSHTWKVRAVDNVNVGTDSATWTFTIDTQAPSFVLSQIGDQSVSISAQDPSTIPLIPIILGANEPLIVATGEANSSVQVTLIIPGDPTQNYTVAVDSSGNWQLQLGILPRDLVMSIDFTITDLAGNVSVLVGVQFIIPSDVIIFPPQPTPSPTPTPLASPEASTTPSGPSPTPELPTPSATPLLVIPVLPPEEIVAGLVQETIERLPTELVSAIENLPELLQDIAQSTAEVIVPNAAVVATVAVPTLSLLSVLSQIGGNISVDVAVKVLQALGLLPKQKPQGIVFDSETGEPIAFALLTITNTDDRPDPIQETVVTDTDGIYQGVKLPQGKYHILVGHQDYIFPTQKDRPNYLSATEYYRGEEFTVSSDKQVLFFLIPVDKKAVEPTEKQNFSSLLKAWLKLFLARFRISNLTAPLFIFSLVIALLFPSVLNWIIVSIYLLMLLRHAYELNKVPAVGGKVQDPEGNPLENAIVRISDPSSGQLSALVSTDEQGEFKAFSDPGLYEISITKKDFIWQKADGGTLSFEEIDTRAESQYLVVTLTPLGNLYKELFG